MSTQLTREEVRQRFSVELAPDEQPLRTYTRYGIVFLSSLAVFVLLLVPVGLLLWWLFHPTPFTRPDLWPLLPAGVYVVGALLYLLYKYTDWRNDSLIMTDQRLIRIEQTILLAQNQRETALSKVQNVRFAVRGLVAHLLDYGYMQIETAARGSDISFGPLRHPDAAQKEIMARVQSIRDETSTQLMQQTLLHRLDPEHSPPPELPSLSGEQLGQRFRDRLHLPFLPSNPLVEGETITWHKHGYFLFLRIVRSLLLLAALAAIAYLLNALKAPGLLWGLWAVGVVIGLGYLVVQYAIWLGDIYVVTADRLHDIYRTPFGLFGESRRSALLERIQNISYDKPGLIPNLLSFGDVRIQTAGAEDLTFLCVPRPEEVQSEIYRRQELSRLRQQQRDREQIAEWLLTYRRIDHGSRGKS
jgi:uncharacterized membrane protein YdbT with pleckstrin-like domain